MRIKVILLAFFFCMTSIQSEAKTDEPASDSITVYIFLHESCLISQYYTLPLLELHEAYATEKLSFVGLFPNRSSQAAGMQAFKETYKIPFELKEDHAHEKKEAFGATVTPEVVVYNESTKEILYKGRIDNTYARVGQRRRVTSSFELKEALAAITNNEPITVANTQSIGCFIENKKVNTTNK